jgi:hypothetical protein
MAQMDVDIQPLAEEDLARNIPCECITTIWWQNRNGTWRDRPPCGRPSTARMHVRCRACGAEYRLFLCRMHVWLFRIGLTVACRVCDRVGRTASRRS